MPPHRPRMVGATTSQLVLHSTTAEARHNPTMRRADPAQVRVGTATLAATGQGRAAGPCPRRPQIRFSRVRHFDPLALRLPAFDAARLALPCSRAASCFRPSACSTVA